MPRSWEVAHEAITIITNITIHAITSERYIHHFEQQTFKNDSKAAKMQEHICVQENKIKSQHTSRALNT